MGEHHVWLQQLLHLLHRALVRGRERSRRPGDPSWTKSAAWLAEGYKDITLLGQNVNSYGRDLGLETDFADLLRACNDIPGDFCSGL